MLHSTIIKLFPWQQNMIHCHELEKQTWFNEQKLEGKKYKLQRNNISSEPILLPDSRKIWCQKGLYAQAKSFFY